MSKKFTLGKIDYSKILKGAMIAMGGALITYGADAIPTIDFSPEWKPLIVAFTAIVINALRKWLEATK